MLQIRGEEGRRYMRRYPKSQSLMKRLEEGWGRKERKQTPILFKDLLKDRPKGGSDSKRRGTTGDLGEQMKCSARTFGGCWPAPAPDNWAGPGMRPGVTHCPQPAPLGPEGRRQPGAGDPGPAERPAKEKGGSPLPPHLPTAGPGVCRSYGGL